ncbi:hypothetical protein ABZ896_46420 [Streptomyces sp. NPDC047072]|uniref:hypothetical protein n=1 Tax=Streptomyces sp. NPDC047072 TaxID=3154809 RepID=UPI003400B3DA
MNTERPENDDTGGSAEEQGVSEHGAGVTAEGSEEAPAKAAGEGEESSSVTEPSAVESEGLSEESPGEEPPASAEASGEDDSEDAPEVPRDEDAGVPHPSRRRSPVAIAAVAAAVLLVGGGGAYFAATASGGGDDRATAGASGDDAPPLLALDGYAESGSGQNGIAPGEPNPYGVTYKADGKLPDGPGSAPVYRTTGTVGKEDVVRLAKALGVEGTPVERGRVWQVGTRDGAGATLQVNAQAPSSWTFARYSTGSDDCKSETVCPMAAQTGDPVGEAAAKKAAAPVLKAVGQDTAKLDATQVMGAQRVVNADPVVGGVTTYGWSTGVIVNAQGEVVGGSGLLKAPVKSATYPVLSAAKTLALLNAGAGGTDHRMGIGGCASPVPLKDRLEAPCGESTSTTSSVPAQNTATVEKAEFGLASQLVSGRQALVPSWLFEVRSAGAADTFTVTYPAVDPKYIASAATPTPTPASPSDEPTSAPATRDMKVDGYSADGTELTVSFTGGVCGDYRASADESADEVAVTVTYTPWPDKVCIMIAKEIQKTVPLDASLGDRKVVGSDGKEIPQRKAGSARLPETSGAR